MMMNAHHEHENIKTENTAKVLMSMTAPGKIFSSRAEIAEHYRSDWHLYNLKRREKGLPMVSEIDFRARLAAVTASLQKEQTADHPPGTTKQELIRTPKEEHIEKKENPDDNAEIEKHVEINPRQCLFDRHESDTVESNVVYMQSKYGFFVLDQEYLTDMEGLIRYCHEKIGLDMTCLYCQRVFASSVACRNHMIAVSHTKIRYEPNVDLDEFEAFYDFSNYKN
jgi:pre-60S factor REI1